MLWIVSLGAHCPVLILHHWRRAVKDFERLWRDNSGRLECLECSKICGHCGICDIKIDRNIFFFFLGECLNNIGIFFEFISRFGNTYDVAFGCLCKFMDIFMAIVKEILALNFSLMLEIHENSVVVMLKNWNFHPLKLIRVY